MISQVMQHKLKSIRARVTRNPLITTFFLVSLVHCVTQAVIQTFLFTLDTEYSSLLGSIVTAAEVPSRNYTDLLRKSEGFRLKICDFIPQNDISCGIVFDTGVDVPSDAKSIEDDSPLRGEILTRYLHTQRFDGTFAPNQSDPERYLQVLAGNDNITLTKQCIQTLLYPDQHLHNSRREDIALSALQLWLFGISVLAMCYDSVPHVLTGLGARTILTAWSIYTLWRTSYQQSVFYQMIEQPGTPCSLSIFSSYFRARIRYEIPDLVLNCSALGFAAYLSWSLIRVFNTESVQRVGAPKEINRIYKYFLAVQVCLQLEAFVLMAWMGLWLDQFNNTYIRPITNHYSIYLAVFIWYTVFLAPWMLVGWFGIKHEKRILTACFILMAFIFTTFACIMFYSQVYRWTFYAWPFWGGLTVASLILLVATFPLSIVCWMNFNKGLAQYLYAESALASSNFSTEVFEHDVQRSPTIKSEKTSKSKTLEASRLPTYYLNELSGSPTSTMVSYDSYLEAQVRGHHQF